MGLGSLLKPIATPIDENNVLRQLMKDRDTRWYAGKLLKVNLIIVSRMSLPSNSSIWLTLPDVPTHHLDE